MYICSVNQMKQIGTYLRRDVFIEWQDKSVWTSSLIYLCAVVFICLHAFEFLESDAWNALFWIVLMFSILTVSGRSFIYESQSYFAYHYHLVRPQIIIQSKLLLNGLYSVVLALIAYLIFSIFLGNQIVSHCAFLLVLLLGAAGIGFTFTMTSSLSSRANGNLVLTSILSLPIILPLLIIVVQLTASCFEPNAIIENGTSFLALFLLNCIIVVLSSLLFPYLWRD